MLIYKIILEVLPKRDDVRQIIIIIGTRALQCNKTFLFVSSDILISSAVACNVIEQGERKSIEREETSVSSLLI